MFCYLDAKKSRWVPLCACIIGNENSKFKRLNGKWSLGGVILYFIVLYCIVLYCIVLYCIVLYFIVLYCIVLYCIVLYCIVLYCIVLYCIFATHKIYNNKRDNRKIQEVAREPKKKP